MILLNNWTTWVVWMLVSPSSFTVNCSDSNQASVHCPKRTPKGPYGLGDSSQTFIDCVTTTSTNGGICAEVRLASVKDKVSEPLLPALTSSLFSNVPPYINFIMPGQQKEPFPGNIGRRLLWYDGGSPLVAATAIRSGYTLTKDFAVAVGYYVGCFQPSEVHKFQNFRPSQKYNHFPGSWSIGCKDRLEFAVRKMKKVHGRKNFEFLPPTFILPEETNLLKKAWGNKPKGNLWILKPPCFHGGRGIEVIRQQEQIPASARVMVQRYISNPYLIDGYKFDMRIYAYVPSINPLRVYLYPDGVVKFATKKFTTDDLDSMVHLTNIEVNAKNPTYTLDFSLKTGHKWSLSVLQEYLKTNNGTDWMPIWEKIKDTVLKTIISGESEIYEGVRKYLQSKYSGHELFGFDILLDNNMKPWVLEVNKSPGLYPHSGHVRPVNDPMARDMLNIAGFRIPGNQGTDDGDENTSWSDVPDHLLLDKRWWTQILSTVQRAKQKYYCDNYKDETILSTILDNLTPDDIRVLVDTIDENSRRGGFDRIFPRLDTDKYFRFFQKPRYYNILIHQWLKRFHKNETEGISLVEAHCKEQKHLSDKN